MKWLQELNETRVLDNGMVQFDVFAEGEGLEVSLDNKSFISPNIEKNGIKGFRFWVNPNDIPNNIDGNKLQNFWVKEWGCLIVPIENRVPEPIKPNIPIVQSPVIDNNNAFHSLWSKGSVGYKYGSDYWQLLDELDGGISNFIFYGQDVNYPKPYTSDIANHKQCTDELVSIHLPSHSVTAIWGHKNARASIQITMKDSDGNIVFELLDTKGGLHPVANAVGSEIGKSQRGNNHPDNCNRWIKYGYYSIHFSNWSQETQDDNFVLDCKFEDTSGKVYFEEKLKPGQETSFYFDIVPLNNEFHGYKINCNYLP